LRLASLASAQTIKIYEKRYDTSTLLEDMLEYATTSKLMSFTTNPTVHSAPLGSGPKGAFRGSYFSVSRKSGL